MGNYASGISGIAKSQPAVRASLIQVRALYRRAQCVYLIARDKQNRRSLEELTPQFRQFSRGSCSITRELKPAYKEYARKVSSDAMAISYELACFLWELCQSMKPLRILDLGTGFSSFVFRRYQSTAEKRPEVWSVDDSGEWLEKTAAFLGSRNLSQDNLLLWDEFSQLEPSPFDLILHDLGNMETRAGVLGHVLALRHPEGVVVLDDIQGPQYQSQVAEQLNSNGGIAGHGLRWLTLDKYLRYAMLVRSAEGNRNA